MLQLEHIGIAVQNLDQSVPLFEQLLGTPCYKTETVASEQVTTAFFAAGQPKIELLEDKGGAGPIGKFLSKKGEGIHHLAFLTDDIEAEIKRLQVLGFELIGETPKDGADNKRVAFLHPKTTNGVLVELCMEKK